MPVRNFQPVITYEGKKPNTHVVVICVAVEAQGYGAQGESFAGCRHMHNHSAHAGPKRVVFEPIEPFRYLFLKWREQGEAGAVCIGRVKITSDNSPLLSAGCPDTLSKNPSVATLLVK